MEKRRRILLLAGVFWSATALSLQAAPSERVVIKGSELVKGWIRVEHDTWTVVFGRPRTA